MSKERISSLRSSERYLTSSFSKKEKNKILRIDHKILRRNISKRDILQEVENIRMRRSITFRLLLVCPVWVSLEYCLHRTPVLALISACNNREIQQGLTTRYKRNTWTSSELLSKKQLTPHGTGEWFPLMRRTDERVNIFGVRQVTPSNSNSLRRSALSRLREFCDRPLRPFSNARCVRFNWPADLSAQSAREYRVRNLSEGSAEGPERGI